VGPALGALQHRRPDLLAVGIPVVLFMENYDINRTGYHDTEDTMKNIDLDYASALAAIAIETVAQAACA
jgi:hypothetical protein